MYLLHVCLHVSFLVELECALGNGTCKWLVICVRSLMREKLVHTPEDLHAHALLLSMVVPLLTEEVGWNIIKMTIGDHFLEICESIWDILFVTLSVVRHNAPSSSLNFLNSLAVALEQAEGL